MAYRFNNTTNAWVEFAIGPFASHAFGPFTWAAYAKFNGTGNRKTLLAFDTNANGIHYRWTLTNGDNLELFDTTNGGAQNTSRRTPAAATPKHGPGT
jgi:hypothetical protein